MRTNPQRLRGLRKYMKDNDLDAFLVTDEINVRYMSGFTGDSSALFVTARRRELVTDGRFIEEAARECPGWKLRRRREGTFKIVGELARKLGIRRMGFEPHAVTVDGMTRLRKDLKGVKLVRTPGVIAGLRLCKDKDEIDALRRAIAIGQQGLARVAERFAPGVTEQRMAADLAHAFRVLGAAGESFPAIMAFRETASLPHYQPGPRRLKAGDPILVDSGAVAGLYCSDLTRVFFTGGRVPRAWRRMYQAVLASNRAGIEAVAPGVRACDVDTAARDSLRSAGYEEEFNHSTGHGVGQAVHEAPRVSAWDKTVLKPGMVITIEPGVYVPGVGGVRIEDMVLVTPDGHDVLTTYPKELDEVMLPVGRG